jgi:hypothetical protein
MPSPANSTPPTDLPRYGTPRRPERPTRGALLGQVAGLLGWSLFGWQHYAGDVAMEYDPRTGLPRYRTVGIGVSRQNGKTFLILVRIVLQLLIPGSVVAYTAQDRSVARFKWQQHVNLLMAIPAFKSRVLHVTKINGSEQILMKNGSVYLIVTPTAEKAGRSISIDLAIIDEAFAQPDMGLVGAISPTMAARPYAQLWILSNAGNSASALWRHYTDLGQALTDDEMATLCWLEWCGEPDIDPETGADLNRFNPEDWRAANPSLGLPGGVTLAALQAAATELDPETFDREHRNLWSDAGTVAGIDALAWAACRSDDPIADAGVVLGVDFTPNRDKGAIVVAGTNAAGAHGLEVLEHTSDLGRIIARTIDVAQRRQATVVIDRGPAGSIVPALERAGVSVHRLSIPGMVAATGSFYDAAIGARLAHQGDYRLTDAVAAGKRRRVGDGFVWDRHAGDLTTLVAATQAQWGVELGLTPQLPRIW